jgi:hypothetical protein
MLGARPINGAEVTRMKRFFKSFCIGCLIGTGLALVVNRWVEDEK